MKARIPQSFGEVTNYSELGIRYFEILADHLIASSGCDYVDDKREEEFIEFGNTIHEYIIANQDKLLVEIPKWCYILVRGSAIKPEQREEIVSFCKENYDIFRHIGFQQENDCFGEEFIIKRDGSFSGKSEQKNALDSGVSKEYNISIKWGTLLGIFIELSYMANKFPYLDFELQVVDYYPDVYGHFEIKNGKVTIKESKLIFTEDYFMS